MPAPTATVLHITPVRAGSGLSVALQICCGAHTEERTFTVAAEDYAALRFLHPYQKAAGRRLVLEQISVLAESADRFAALEQGLSLLSYGDATKAGLIRKLRRRGISAEIAEASAEQLAARGYIDECAQIERFLRNELRKGRGARRILAAAREKGYGDEAVARLRDRLAEIDFAEVCAAVIDKKWGTLPTACDARQKAVAALLRLGFSLGEIQSAVRASASKAD